MSEHKIVKRLGFEPLKKFLNESETMYDKYDKKAKDYNEGSILMFERQGKNVVFYVEIKKNEININQNDDPDDYYEMEDIIFTK